MTEEAKPRVVQVHRIFRDKKKPYTKYINSKIIRGNSWCGITDEVLNKEGEWSNLGNPEDEMTFATDEAAQTYFELNIKA